MKKILLLLVSVIIVLGMAACDNSKKKQEEQMSDVEQQQYSTTPEAAVIGYLNAFQSGRQDKANQYVTENDIIYSESTEDKGITEIQILFGNITYNIKSVNMEENDTAIVTTDITNVDMNIVMQSIQNALKTSVDSSAMTEEDIMTMIQQAIEQNKDNTITKTIDIEVIQINDEWKVKTTSELLTAISGGVTPEGINI